MENTQIKYVVKFKGNRRELYNAPEGLEIKAGMHAIVQAERGEDMGLVLRKAAKNEYEGLEVKSNILRIAAESDVERLDFNRQKEIESKSECLNFIDKHGLNMKLVDVEYQFDCNKITFYFTAEKRVDFRELVKDLAATFRTRIELRQIGVRDEAKRIGGYGICGKEQCCSSFLNDFQTISTQMARTQNLALNPQKISGNCGRLLCCLHYEQDFYEKTKTQYPPNYCKCVFHGQHCRVQKTNIFTEEISLYSEDMGLKVISLLEYKRALKRGKFKLLETNPAGRDDRRNRRPENNNSRDEEK